jgi:hypothetical protein
MTDSGGDQEDYKRKRVTNNLSVKLCREKQKKKIEEAKIELEGFKAENENLKDKYDSLQKELNLYKSLFTQRLESSAASSVASISSSISSKGSQQSQEIIKNDASENQNKRPRQSSEIDIIPPQAQLEPVPNQPLLTTHELAVIDDFISESTNDFLNLQQQQQQQELIPSTIHPSSSYSSFNVVPGDDTAQNMFIINNDEFTYSISSSLALEPNEGAAAAPTFFLNDENYQVNYSNGIISNENMNKNINKEPSIVYCSEKQGKEEEETTTKLKYVRKTTIPMPFHHEYAFIKKTNCRKK